MDNERRKLIQIADLYYNQELTQQQIANIVGLSRMKVSRLLQKAKNSGIVTISIDYSGVYLELEKQLAEKYHLNKVIIVPGASENVRYEVVNAAAYFLNSTLEAGDLIAVGWGKTLRAMLPYCDGDFNNKIEFVPMIGGHGKSELDLHASTIAATLAKNYHSNSLSLLAPAFVDTKADRDNLMKDAHIKEVLQLSNRANKAIFSMGNPSYLDSSIYQTGYFSNKDIAAISSGEAICDIASLIFLNKAGDSILKSLTDRSIGISETDFKAIPEKICIAYGNEKHESIKVAAHAGFIDTLIIDLASAQYLAN